MSTSRLLLKDISTRAPEGIDKSKGKVRLASLLDDLSELQNLLAAEPKHAVLVVIQGMDASGKDGLVRDVFGRMNPQGVHVHSFKVPTEEEASHDFLWRIHQRVPAKGYLQVFNRSHYEDVLVPMIHGTGKDSFLKRRMDAINNFERLLIEHGNTTIIKLYLHISYEEQQSRLKERIENPSKMWKYNASDFEESKRWKDYHRAYEVLFKHCDEVPWNIVPADQNWYKELVVAELLRDTLKGLDLKYPGLKKEGLTA
jgi:PPK2 family polyphosphate:nucleotide phosphotransferase